MRRGIADRPFAWMYRHHRPHYPEALTFFSAFVIMGLIVPFYAFLLKAIAGASWSYAARMLVVFEVATLPIPLAVYAGFWVRHRPALDWIRRPAGPEGAAAARVEIVRGMPRTVAWLVVLTTVTCTPGGVYGASVIGLSAGGTAAYLACIAWAVAGAGVVLVFLCEIALGPVLRDVNRFLPPDSPPVVGVPSLRFRLLALVLLTDGLACAVAIALTRAHRGPGGAFASVFLVAVPTSLVFSAVIGVVLRDSLLRRVDTLHRAMGRVERGDLSARLTVIGDDEVDDLNRGFNQMVARLHSYESELRESRFRIVAAADTARRQVERDLHDGAQQHLVVAKLQLAQLRRLALEPEAAAIVARAQASLCAATEELRDLAHGLYPAALETDGLHGALSNAVERLPHAAGLEADGIGRYPGAVEAAVYFCCSEALQNAAKHAGAGARVLVSLVEEDDRLRFEVRDDGAGYLLGPTEPHGGVQNMRDRVGALGGWLTVDTAPGRGTVVRGWLPVSPRDVGGPAEALVAAAV